MKGFEVQDRTILAVTGPDAEAFLQGLVTIDVAALGDTLGYGALLSPQGKFLFDFFIFRVEDGFWLDSAAEAAPALAQRLTLYRLRAKVEIAPVEVTVFVVEGDAAGLRDPRHRALGSRVYGAAPDGLMADPAAAEAYDKRLIALGVPTSGRELRHGESYILEAGFERLSGVDFKKGCYVGQEVTARMRHKTELRKGLVQVRILAGTAEPGAEVLGQSGRVAGQILSVFDGLGLAYVRLDRAGGVLNVGAAQVEVVAPVWALG